MTCLCGHHDYNLKVQYSEVLNFVLYSLVVIWQSSFYNLFLYQLKQVNRVLCFCGCKYSSRQFFFPFALE